MSRAGTRRAALYKPVIGVDWWLVAGKTCILAYAPKGAASYAASLVNLSNPGTYDAAEGVAPSFNAATGWKFTRSGATYLTSGYRPVEGVCTVLCCYEYPAIRPIFSQALCGNKTEIGGVVLGPAWGANQVVWFNDGLYFNTDPWYSSGVMGVAGTKAYMDGIEMGSVSGSRSSDAELFIGASQNGSGTPSEHCDAYIKSLVVFAETLSGAQVLALSAAMAAL